MVEALSKTLLRDNLNDHGEIPSVGATYASPDIIVHEDIADPYKYLSDNYHLDITKGLIGASEPISYMAE